MAGVEWAALAMDLWEYEQQLVHTTVNYAGVDEAGRGALAGPVVAAAVIIGGRAEDWVGVSDSKALSKKQREKLSEHIWSKAVAVGIGMAQPNEIDELNILHASRLAMARALYDLKMPPKLALVDGPYPPLFPSDQIESIPVIDGDAKCLSVAAASIIAKVERDKIMAELHTEYPQYGFHKNAGYPTSEHLAALDEVGPSVTHRQSYRPVQRASQARLDLTW
ncbi:ribonuclease HII [Alicyclobacillus mengziensis]|nr:ribonuclease HII [Alicyclobacillus mengziensis]